MYTIKKEYYGCLVNLGAQDVLLTDDATQEQLKAVHEAVTNEKYVIVVSPEGQKSDKPETVGTNSIRPK